MTSSSERLRQLEHSEKSLVTLVSSLGLALQELSKEKTGVKQVRLTTLLVPFELYQFIFNSNFRSNYMPRHSWLASRPWSRRWLDRSTI